MQRCCKTCRNSLHAECVSRLGKSHADAALSGAECSHCECFSLAPLRSRLAFFSESDSAPCAEKKLQADDLSSRWQGNSRRLNARVPRHHHRRKEHSPVLFTQHDQRPSTVSDMILFGARDSEIDNSLFFLVASEAVIGLCDWPRPLTVVLFTQDLERMRS